MAETTVDYEDAERFLKLLDPDAEVFDFRCIHPKSGDVWNDSGTQADLHDELLDYNSNGFGVFLTINETDGKGRRTENIKRVRAVWQDDDNGWKGEYPLEPSIVVQTSAGKHQRYWLVDGPMELMSFGSIMARIVQDHGGDAGAKDLARVLRLPGYYHTKGERQPVEIIGGSGKRYTEAGLIEAFPPIARKVTEPREAGEASQGWQRDKGRVEAPLRFLAGIGYAESRENWFKYGAAIFDSSGGSDQTVWDAWAKSCPEKYKQGHQDYYWNYEFDSDRGNRTTIATIFDDAYKAGWKETNTIDEYPEPDTINLDDVWINDDWLANTTLANMKIKFDKWGHNPSPEHWRGLRHIAKVMDFMAHNSCSANYYISFLPPGMGKTTTLVEATKALASNKIYDHVGVIIFLSRLEEISKLVDKMELKTDDYAVIVNPKDSRNLLGNQDKTKAKVLFTTQQGLEARAKSNRDFSAMAEFFYNGKPRLVRVWDEAILPSKILILRQLDIPELWKTISAENKELYQELREFFNVLENANDHDVIQVPDIDKYNLDMEEARALFPDGDSRRDAIEALWKSSGRMVRVRNDVHNAALEYVDIFPDDLAPMLILDASGSLRLTYRFWQQYRRNFKFLPSPSKSYKGFTVHHWDRGSGRTAHTKDAKTIIRGVAKTINNDIPKDADVLVIHFKKSKYIPDMEDGIRGLIKENRDRVKFCHWGIHTATNDYAHIKYVILAGVLQYNTSEYEAYGRSAMKLNAEDEFKEKDFNGTRLGEISHNIFQAACRGYVRLSEGDSCPSNCHLYIIFSTHKKTGIPQELMLKIFPQAEIEDWYPDIVLKGKQALAVGIIEQSAKMNVKMINKQELMQKVDINNIGSLNRMLSDKNILAALNEKNIKMTVGRKDIELA